MSLLHKNVQKETSLLNKEWKMRVIIAAAGTAGHINPGIAIANKIKQEEKNSEIIFIGTTRGLENDLVPRAGFELKTIEAYGLSKKITVDNLKKMYRTLKGYGEAKKIIQAFKPDIVIGTGGYICGASILAAHHLKIPTMLHESNSFPGRAVKMLAKKTDTILVSFQDAIPRIKKAKNVVFTGTPVKIKKRNYSSDEKSKILKEIGIQETKPIILVSGGSQGAQKINEAVLDIIQNKRNKNYQMIWATGPKQYDKMKEKIEEKGLSIHQIEGIKMVPYIYNMEEMMNVIDISIGRAGAMTVTEIANLGKPSILVPLPNVSHNHQLYNAKVLEKVGAANIILNDELTGEKLNQVIEEMISNKAKLQEMGEKAKKVSTQNVEDKIYQEIKKLLVK